LTWMPQGGKSDSLFAATGENSNSEAITELLIHARRALASYSKLSLDFPVGEMTDAISAAGFKPRRTLIWMKAERDE